MNDDQEPEHGRPEDVVMNSSLVRPYVIPGVTFIPVSEAIKPCPYPCDCCRWAGRQ